MENNIENLIKNKTNEQLLDDIGLGANAYQNGIFELYLIEAKKRGLDITDNKLEIIKNNKIDKNLVNEAKRYLMVGILLFLFCAGLFAFIPGLALLKKDEFGKYIYPEKYKIFAKFSFHLH